MRVITIKDNRKINAQDLHNDLGEIIERLYNASREDNKRGFILRHMLVLPTPYPQMAIFSYVWKWGCIRGSKYYRITKNESSIGSRKRVYLRKKKMLDIYMKYISYYYDNRIEIDDYIGTMGRYFSTKTKVIFMEIMKNPFLSTILIANKFKIKSSTVRQYYKRCRKMIMKDDNVMRPLLMDMNRIVFGRYKTQNEND